MYMYIYNVYILSRVCIYTYNVYIYIYTYIYIYIYDFVVRFTERFVGVTDKVQCDI